MTDYYRATCQLRLLQLISISEHTSNSRPVASPTISCHCYWWSGAVLCCIARLDTLDPVEDAYLLRSRFVAHLALGAVGTFKALFTFSRILILSTYLST
jgi:hypothetical protein